MNGKNDLALLTEAICLDKDRMPSGLEKDLEKLREMLEEAVWGAEAADPQAPAYGVTARPAADTDGKNDAVLLRQDRLETRDTRLIGLSSRRDGDYVNVPQVVRQ